MPLCDMLHFNYFTLVIGNYASDEVNRACFKSSQKCEVLTKRLSIDYWQIL